MPDILFSANKAINWRVKQINFRSVHSSSIPKRLESCEANDRGKGNRRRDEGNSGV